MVEDANGRAFTRVDPVRVDPVEVETDCRAALNSVEETTGVVIRRLAEAIEVIEGRGHRSRGELLAAIAVVETYGDTDRAWRARELARALALAPHVAKLPALPDFADFKYSSPKGRSIYDLGALYDVQRIENVNALRAFWAIVGGGAVAIVTAIWFSL